MDLNCMHPPPLPQSHPAVVGELDLVTEEDQITHLLSLGDEYDSEEILNVFQPDDDYLANEEKYKMIKSGERKRPAYYRSI